MPERAARRTQHAARAGPLARTRRHRQSVTPPVEISTSMPAVPRRRSSPERGPVDCRGGTLLCAAALQTQSHTQATDCDWSFGAHTTIQAIGRRRHAAHRTRQLGRRATHRSARPAARHDTSGYAQWLPVTSDHERRYMSVVTSAKGAEKRRRERERGERPRLTRHWRRAPAATGGAPPRGPS